MNVKNILRRTVAVILATFGGLAAAFFLLLNMGPGLENTLKHFRMREAYYQALAVQIDKVRKDESRFPTAEEFAAMVERTPAAEPWVKGDPRFGGPREDGHGGYRFLYWDGDQSVLYDPHTRQFFNEGSDRPWGDVYDRDRYAMFGSVLYCVLAGIGGLLLMYLGIRLWGKSSKESSV